MGSAIGNRIKSLKINLHEQTRGYERHRGRSCSLSTLCKPWINGRVWNVHLCELLDRPELFLSTTSSRATSGITGGHQSCFPQAGMKEHQSPSWFTSQIFDRNLNFWLSHKNYPDQGSSSGLSLLGLWYFLPCWFVPTEPQAWTPFQRYFRQLVPLGHSLSISSASKIIRAETHTHVATPPCHVFLARFQCQTCEWSQFPWLSDPISHPF